MIDILFDCDTGHDDAIALMVALAHPKELRVCGITTVAGNHTLENTTRNTLMVLDHLEIQMEVSAGCDRPMRYLPEPQPTAHGESGMDGHTMDPPVSQVTGMHAVDYLRTKLMEADHKLVLVALGPLTNVGVLLFTYPEVKEKIEKICIMGGSLTSGNILPKAEFNIYHDPDAARIVFRSGIPIIMSGLEVCEAGSILLEEYPDFRQGGRASHLAWELLEFYCGYARDRGWDRTPIFDMTTIIQLLRPELFASEQHAVDVETEGELCRGMTVADLRPSVDPATKRTCVLTDVLDRDAFIGVLKESLSILDKRCVN